VATALKGPVETQPKRVYLPELDTLRFGAFFAVFIFHASAETGRVSAITVAGNYGVDLFFCLSAFLISNLLLREKELTGSLDVRAFWIRRALRIWPLYFGMLALAVALGDVSRNTLLACLLFSGNFGFIFWGMPAFIGPLWSISVEEQFYLVWPLAVRRLSRERIARVAVVLWLLSIAVRCLLALLVARHPRWPASCSIFNTFCRLDPIAAGLLLSSVGGAWRVNSFRARACLGASGVLLLLLTADLVYNAPELWLVCQIFAFTAVAVGCLALLIATIGAGGFAHNSTLVYLGRISYGLYVFHKPALMLAHRLSPVLILPAGAVITVALAAASYRWFETPFLRLKSGFEHIPSRPV
jgi:peptidoglycan/LPS O-acetylase OafA/YrhL